MHADALRTTGPAAAFPCPLPAAPAAPAPLPPSLPAPAPSLVPVPTAAGAGGVAPYSDGVRAIGAVSPAPAVPTPVVQQQLSPATPAAAHEAKPRTAHNSEDDPLMLDAAEARPLPPHRW